MQSTFVKALLDPGLPVPVGLTDPEGRVDEKRFAVYRNNVSASLSRVLEAAFPVVRKLVGDDFFAAMAVEFLRAHPPQTRLMMLYGADFAGFLTRFPPVGHLGYLPDVARLEQAIRESYHAADAVPVDPAMLGDLDEGSLLAARFDFAPSLRLVRSAWPIHAIWRANTEAGPAPEPGGEDVVILRPGFDPRPHLLTTGGGDLVAELHAGRTLEVALAAVGAEVDLAAVLTLLLSQGAVAKVRSCKTLR
jgi:hypothetical protein